MTPQRPPSHYSGTKRLARVLQLVRTKPHSTQELWLDVRGCKSSLAYVLETAMAHNLITKHKAGKFKPAIYTWNV